MMSRLPPGFPVRIGMFIVVCKFMVPMNAFEGHESHSLVARRAENVFSISVC